MARRGDECISCLVLVFVETLLPLQYLKWDNNICAIWLIVVREVSPPFGEEPCALRSNRTRAFVYFMFKLTNNADSCGIVP